MGSTHESGHPNMKRVYLRRRLTVLGILLALVVAGVLIVVQPGSSGSASSARTVEVPSDLAASEQSESAQSADPGEAPQCGPGQLRVLPLTSRDSYAPNELPELALTLENVGDTTCVAEAGTAAMVFEITSGSDSVWRSVDCQKNGSQQPVLLQAGESLTTQFFSWDRERSSPETCEIGQDSVAAAGGATYHLRVEAAGAQGEGTAAFLLY